MEQAATTSLAEFLKALSDVLVHGGNSAVARMAAGLQLKNHLTSKDLAIKEQYQQRWLHFPEDTREYIKKNVNIFYQILSRQNILFFNLFLRFLELSEQKPLVHHQQHSV